MTRTVKTVLWLAFLALSRSNAQDVEAPKITEDMTSACAEKGFCEDLADYPKELVDKLLEKAGSSVVLHSETEQTPVFNTRRADGESFTDLCEADKTVITPRAAMTKNNKWVWVVNEMDSNRQQKYTVEVCKDIPQACSKLVTTEEGYTSSCRQLYAFRTAAVLDPGSSKITYNQLRLPSCCQCQGGV